jgi:hypothetical protein
MPDDTEKVQRRASLKRDLMETFNRVAAKVVKIDELVENFDNLAGENMGFFERQVAKHKMGELQKKEPPPKPGVYVEPGPDGREVGYVSTQFLKDGVMWAVDNGKMDGHEDSARRAAYTTVKAIERSADQTPRVQSGEIKPKKPGG